ncbi:MAG: TonB-dependent receptor plug domain-containing protein [Candidatus Marinimicrobia bacterium]|nr:TonB-dependent receptor plug domain-containing protein [Candidatus Neomarinimicrobiota bacterium]
MLLALLLLPGMAFAQVSITGTVIDAENEEPLPGVNVIIEGTAYGAATDVDGTYHIRRVDLSGSQTIIARMIGYETGEETVTLPSSGEVTVDFSLTSTVIKGAAINVVADRARERETPVAFTNVDAEELSYRLASREIPLALNTTPSVYATQGGGGSGDARINIRGFNQRNVAIMINGVPVNDMENGWVYWSNWSGIGDITNSIQVQRGLSAVNLAVPSIGGTMNVLTDPAGQSAGGFVQQEFGNNMFRKTSVVANTGLVDGKYALSAALFRKTGDGIIDGTWLDEWAYYFGASYSINENNRLEFYALGAPQRHGQNLYRQNIGVYDQEFARSLDSYDEDAFDKFNEAGRYFNQNWNYVDGYNGPQAWNEDVDSRFAPHFISERENFYHKPQVNLNWYTRPSDNLLITSIIYYSGGQGGGTGTYGDMERDPWEQGELWFNSSPWTWNWDRVIAINDTSSTGSVGILRNSRNNQWTIGAISKANYRINDNLKFTGGIDWRTAEIEHYRELRDLLGGDYFDPSTVGEPVSPFWSASEMRRGLTDKIDYDFTNTVDWIGAFGQAEYTTQLFTLYGTLGYSTIKYSHDNHFYANDAGNPIQVESDWISGYQVKGGASYRITAELDAYANLGYVAKVPIFDNVISDQNGALATDPENEKFFSYEAGINYRSLNGMFAGKANLYHTTWSDRANSIGVEDQDGDESIIFITGLNTLHQGIEFEGSMRPIELFKIDAAVSFGDWYHLDDVQGTFQDYGADTNRDTVNYYVQDLKVGDAPQTQYALGLTLYPMDGMQIEGIFRHYRDFFADWDPFSRTDPEDRVQSWKAPAYSIVDLHVGYMLPFEVNGLQFEVRGHVFNLLDEIYVQDATDNSRFNAWDYDHDADDAEVYLGIPRNWNIGITAYF